MKTNSKTVEEYIDSLEVSKREMVGKVRMIFKQNLPLGFVEGINYGGIGYCVPLEIYPRGYCNDKSKPIPFINLIAQKNHLSLHHMGLYAVKELSEWFEAELIKEGVRIDRGKGCFRFKYSEPIPNKVFKELAKKISVADFIELYEKALSKK